VSTEALSLLAVRQGESPSLRADFGWSLAGNLVYAGCQWAVLVVLAKLGNPEMVGQYAFGLAIAQPILMFSRLQLRTLLTTDVDGHYYFGEYLGFRLMTTAIGLLIIVVLNFVMRYSRESALPILMVGFSESLEAISDIYWGQFQVQERMDRIAKSMIARGPLSLMALGAGIYLTRNVLWGVVGLALARVVVLLSYDIRSSAHPALGTLQCADDLKQQVAVERDALRPRWNLNVHGELFWISIPLGVISLLATLHPNIPRYFVESSLGPRGVGIFSATAFLLSSGNLVVVALAQSACVPLAKSYARKNSANFKFILLKLLGITTLLGVGGLLVAVSAGRRLLTLIYGPEYGDHTDLLVTIMAAGAIQYPAAMIGVAVTSARFFNPQIPLLASVIAASYMASHWLIPSHGLVGAGWATVFTSLALLVGQMVLLCWVLRTRREIVEVSAAT
jgi:O-antigen/teichoic acid export membrane protein